MMIACSIGKKKRSCGLDNKKNHTNETTLQKKGAVPSILPYTNKHTHTHTHGERESIH
jgi:hypothetical protein